MDFEKLNNEFEKINESNNEEEKVKEKFAFFLKKILEEKHYSQDQLGKALGLSQNIISKWIKKKVHPDNLITKNFRGLAELAGWTTDKLSKFIYSVDILEISDFDDVKDKANKLPILKIILLIDILNKTIYAQLSDITSKRFADLLINYIVKEKITVNQAASRFRIMPSSRFQEILDGELPSNTEIMKIASQGYLSKKSGEKFSFIELYNLAFNIEENTNRNRN